MGAMPIVFVVDDDQAVRDSLRWLIESVGYRAAIFESADGFIQERRDDGPACLLLDVRLPGMSGLELQRIISETGRSMPVILITGHGDVRMAVSAMKCGAFDFMEKPFDDTALLDRIRQALSHDEGGLQQQARRDGIASHLALLTPREREVFDMVVQGHSNRNIAQTLQISPKTIEVHRAHMMRKMKAESVAALVRMSMVIEHR